MSQLFMVYLGGRAGQCHIEVHDVRFVVGDKIEDTYPQLIHQWYGHKNNLHLDSYHQVETVPGADGRTYQVRLVQAEAGTAKETEQEPGPCATRTNSAPRMKLYFVNLGGYQPDQMAEQHAFGLFACRTANEAKQMAKYHLLPYSHHQHKDNLHDVDDCLPISLLDNWRVELTVTQLPAKPLTPDWFGYEVIG